MNVALFHPWIKSRGGAEKVVLEYLKNSKNKIDLYTWVYDVNNTFDEFKNFNVHVIAPKLFSKFSRLFILRGLFLLSLPFSKIRLDHYDKFLISSGGFGELITLFNYKPRNTYIYSHTILRAAYSEDMKFNFRTRFRNPFIKLVYILAAYIYRFFERLAWKRIDYAIFNSSLSLERAKQQRLLNKITYSIIYPGVDLEHVGKSRNENYFLYVSRFNAPKRQDLVIAAWERFITKNKKYKLILVGNVDNESYFKRIKEMAKNVDGVEIKQGVESKELRRLYSCCCASIFVPFMEDFGIVPFETLAHGKTIISVDKGGFADLISLAPSVILFKERYDFDKNVGGLHSALIKFDKNKNRYLSNGNKNCNYLKTLNLGWDRFAKQLDESIKERH